jgi:hypothetical protein
MSKVARLGFGEYATDEATLTISRAYFLRAVQRTVPEVLTSLAGEPLEAYCRAVADASQHTVYRKALQQWAERWHLEADWCLDTAMRTLRVWAVQPAGSPLLGEWDYPAVSYFTPSVQPFSFTHPGWEPSAGFTTRAEAAQAMRVIFEAELSTYLDDMEAAAVAIGMQRSPEKRNPEHFMWLARYQVEGHSYHHLAKNVVYRDRKSVAEGVQQVAGAIGLPLREPSKPGKPRAS